MGCLGHRKKVVEESADQKWDYICLDDFKAKGCGPGFAYVWLWFLLIISVAVYGVDTFTAVNLLILDNWSSKIDPGIPFSISKWIFSACIILSFINLGFEAWRAVRVIKEGNVAASYLDPLAVRWESIRVGSGQGWKRFLVFAELTKDRKGAEYTALFTYFNLQAWIRVLLCSGPRQVINAFTFKSVYESKLLVEEATVEGSITGFFEKIKALAEEDYQQAVILGAMGFTLIVWVFSFIFFVAAVLCYVTFLCHWIPRGDGGLAGYCERKVNQRLKKIVTQKVNKALAKGQHQRYKEAIKNGEKFPLDRAATLPTLPNVAAAAPSGPAPIKEDALPEMPMLSRNETMTSLPAYSSRPGSPGRFEMNNMDAKRPIPSRSGTMTTTTSYSSRAALISSAADMGSVRSASPVPNVPDINMANIPAGPGMGYGHTRSDSGRRMPPNRSLTGRTNDTYDQGITYSSSNPARRQYDEYTPVDRAGPTPAGSTYHGWGPNPRDNSAWPTPGEYQAQQPGPRASPAPTAYSEPPRGPPYQPSRSATGQVPPRGPQFQPPQRTMTAPIPVDAGGYDGSQQVQGGGYYGSSYGENYARSGTYQGQGQRRDDYGYDVESQRNFGYER